MATIHTRRISLTVYAAVEAAVALFCVPEHAYRPARNDSAEKSVAKSMLRGRAGDSPDRAGPR